MRMNGLVVTGLILLAAGSATMSAGPAMGADTGPVDSPLDATYRIEGAPVRLHRGRAGRPAAPGSATRTETRVVGAPAHGDIDGDGDSDALLFLASESGGSGTFYYVAAAYRDAGGYRGGPAVLIGDRITPRRLAVLHGVVVVDYLDRASGEPMAVQPRHALTAYLIPDGAAWHPVVALAPGEKVVEGMVTIGHEVRAFEPCAAPAAYWLMGDSPAYATLLAAYRDATTGTPPYTPLLMVLAGHRSAPPANGFAADYDDGWRVTRVIRALPAGDCKGDQIVLTLPTRGSTVSSPLEIRGRARGTWFFEGDFPLTLSDGAGNRIAQGFATAQGEWMTSEFVPFSAVLHFPSPRPGPGHLILKKDNPSDNRDQDDALVVPIRLQ